MGLKRGQKIMTIILSLIFIMLTLPLHSAYGGWTGPLEVVVNSWGGNPGQFGIESGDTADNYPTQLGVDKDGTIISADEVNRRVQIFRADGSLLKIINKPAEINVTTWPRSLIVSPDGGSFLGNLYIFNYAGDILYKINIARTERYGISTGYIVKNLDNNQYYLYSSTGQLIKTSTTRPLELGRVQEQILGENKYKVTVSYPDMTYSLMLRGPYEKYVRDNYGYFYAVSEKLVKRFNTCGRELGVLTLPDNQVTIIPPSGQGSEERAKLIAQYGEPVIAPNGDVYTWKRTPSNYSILKWTWVDDPNVPSGPDAPTGLSVIPSTSGLYLTWTASPNDPGCVTGYEIARATSAGGVFSTVGTVEKGVIKYNDTTAAAGTTYYYKVRAAAGSEYSNYTAEVSGKR